MTLNTLISRAASLLAAASLSLVAVYGQTTYSSPVRVTNTPLPVSGAVQVTVPPGVPLPVKIGDTLSVVPAAGSMPVVQQGTVTVTPAGGTMSVTPAGGTMPVSGTVGLSGTPAVTLSGVANQVRLAGTPFSRRGLAVLPDGGLYGEYSVGTLPAGSLVEIEFASMRCGFEQPGYLFWAEINVLGPSGITRYSYPMPMASYLTRGTIVWYHAALPVKIYATGDSELMVRMQRSAGTTGFAECTLAVSGRSY
jgi:hypothetical protein